MKKLVYFFVLLFFSCVLTINTLAQEKNNLQNASKITFAEKIYIQLNSTVFTTDQTIWLKAIVTNANQKPSRLSNILHVDLINFDEKIIASKLLKLENGSTNSFFDLLQLAPLPTGKYLIRAYTRWNNNFKENFVCKQYINLYKPRKTNTNKEPIKEVLITQKENKQLQLSAKIFPKTINPKFKGKLKVLLDVDGKKDSVEIKKDDNKEYSFNYLLPDGAVKAKIDVQLDSVKIKNFDFKTFNSFSKTIVIDKKFIDLQFFPEGGKLIDGLNSKIAFKALDYKNEGIRVEGVITDQNNNVITEFKSNQLGMGFCQLKAEKNKTYQATIKVDKNLDYKFTLPQIYEKGYVLTTTQTKQNFNLHLKSNFSLSDSLTVNAVARGINYFNTKVKCKNGKVKIAFNKNAFPEGIVTFTVFNQFNQPLCERLLFNYKENSNRLKIITKTDKKRYRQRDKISFDIYIKNKDSLNLHTNTSFLAINKKQLGEMQLKRNTILSYFLLQSELKGTIEQPSFYFDKNNKHRFYAMDALLLTQGWRNYVYQPIENDYKFEIAPEKNLQISGSIEGYEKRKHKKPIQLTLVAKGKENMQASVSVVDSLGKFSFDLQDIYNDDLEYIIQSQNHKGKKREYSINIDKTKRLPVHFKNQETLQLADKFDTYVKENIKRYTKENPFSVGKNGFALDEVVVKTRLINPVQEKMNEEHGEPDIVIETEELVSKKKKWSYGLLSILIFNYSKDVQIIREFAFKLS